MPSVVVVGGGVAGLTCAWRLQRAGFDVEVLERGDEPGGRMRSETQGEFRIDRGAPFVTSGYRNLHALASVLPVADRVRELAPTGEAVLRSGRLHPVDLGAPLSLLRSSLLSRPARARLLRLFLELVRDWRRLDPWQPERAATLDRENLAAGLWRTVGEESSEFLLAPLFSATFDSEPEDLSFAIALVALRLFASGSRRQSFEGGAGALTQALAEDLPVRCGCEVVAIETQTDGARVRYRARGRESGVLADAAVVAVPGCGVAELCPKLTPEERGFFELVSYARGIVAHLLLESAPVSLPFHGVSFPRREGLDLYAIAVDHHKPGAAPPGAGLVHAALTLRAAQSRWRAPDAAIAELVVENLARTPIGRLSPVGCVVHRWSPMLPQFQSGYLARLGRFLGRVDRSPRLTFAGDYLVGPTVEGAVTSGMRAATEIARSL